MIDNFSYKYFVEKLEISRRSVITFCLTNQITVDDSQLRLASLRNLGNFVFTCLVFQGI